jgi:hypothetical protein
MTGSRRTRPEELRLRTSVVPVEDLFAIHQIVGRGPEGIAGLEGPIPTLCDQPVQVVPKKDPGDDRVEEIPLKRSVVPWARCSLIVDIANFWKPIID